MEQDRSSISSISISIRWFRIRTRVTGTRDGLESRSMMVGIGVVAFSHSNTLRIIRMTRITKMDPTVTDMGRGMTAISTFPGQVLSMVDGIGTAADTVRLGYTGGT